MVFDLRTDPPKAYDGCQELSKFFTIANAAEADSARLASRIGLK
jgi:hypothetical protein